MGTIYALVLNPCIYLAIFSLVLTVKL
uniref:Uncharacterized protein n=1 Tax=Arundo donax TaxID=35708 RepID=A0A0A8YSM6_ARUDO